MAPSKVSDRMFSNLFVQILVQTSHEFSWDIWISRLWRCYLDHLFSTRKALLGIWREHNLYLYVLI